ncbi:MAG: PQQ-like beta-propeller repeat protein [Fuerstiella sp.]|nr:PQQ-like beta-propeller repeat protein [Fuerstiella sp.]
MFLRIGLRVTLSFCFISVATVATAGDWPQILGTQRDGIAIDEKLLSQWPKSGPEEVWQAKVGQGFAGVAVNNDVVYLFHRLGRSEIVEARYAVNGEPIWKQSFSCDYRGGVSSDTGPRCVPLVTAGYVYVFSVEGIVRCLKSSDGQQVWYRDTAKDFSPPDSYFGAGSTPALHDGKLIVNVGGRKNAAVVAFSAVDGETVWKNVSDAASYSSPVVANVNGTRHALVVSRNNMLSLNPTNGKVRFRFPFGMRGPTVNGATPVVIGNHVFVSSSYRVGSVWASLTEDVVKPQRSGEKLLATQYATPIRQGRLLFAVDGRQDVGSASLKCIDPSREKVLWTKNGFDYGTMIRVNQELLMLTFGGELIRIAADPEMYRELQRSNVLDPTPRGYRLPAISNGRLFIRDSGVLKCLQVGESS